MKLQRIKIRDLGKIVTGNTPPRKEPDYYGNAYPFIKPTDIELDTRFTYNPEECYSEKAFEKYKNSLIPKGSTCVVTIGSIGKKITMAYTDCFINQAMNAVNPYDNFDPYYVFYLLKYNLYKVKALDSGTSSGRENVSKSSFGGIEVDVCLNKETQIKIGEILCAYDDLIENHLRRLQLLEKAIQCEYQLLIEASNTNAIPLGEIVKLGGGYAFKSKDWQIDGLPVIKIRNVGANTVDVKNCDCVPESIAEQASNFEIFEGNLLIAMTGATVGKIGLMPKVDRRYFLNQRVGVFRTSLDYDTTPLLFCAFNQESTQQQVLNLAGGAAQPNISGNQIESITIKVPADEMEIKKFCEKSSLTLALIANLKYQANLLQEARDILLPRLMNGEIDLSNVPDLTTQVQLVESE